MKLRFLIVVQVFALLNGAVLAAPASTNLLQWGETLDMGSGFWMRMACVRSNDWLGVITRIPRSAPSSLRVLESTNGCRDWALVSEVQESDRRLDNGNLLVLPDGSVLLACRSVVEGQSYRLPVYRSADGGHAWTNWSNIDSNEGAPGTLFKKGLWEPHLFLLPDGRLSVVYSNEKHSGCSQVLSQKISADGGRTWGPEMRIVEQPGGGELRPGMGVPARMSNGRFILVYEVVGRGNADVYLKSSKDGTNWPEGLGTALAGQQAAPFVLTLADGTLLVTSCTHRISASADAGKTWKDLGTAWVMPFHLNWPALYELRPGAILSVISNPQVKLRFGMWNVGGQD